MKTQIAEILSELYALDPELAKKEPELTKILSEMLVRKPDTHFDENFRTELKTKLSAEIAKRKWVSSGWTNWKSIFAGFLVGSSAIGIASYFLLPSIAPISIETPNTGNNQQIATPVVASKTEAPMLATNTIDFGFKAERKAAMAFGSISQSKGSESQSAASADRVRSPSPMNNSISAVPIPNTPPTAVGIVPAAVGKIAVDSRMVISQPYQPQRYSYEYSGSGYVFKDTKMAVFQKKKNAMSSVETDALLKNFKISSIDLAQFSQLKLNTISMSEDREYGLMLNIDFTEGTITLSKNWNLWPQSKCIDTQCLTQISDIPSDDTVLETVWKFIKTYGIDISSYGKPTINNDWKVQYSLATDKTFAYVPDTVTVIYPLLVEGKPVYEEYGQPKGMTINVDVKTGRVSDVYGMDKLNFESSDYEVQTDFPKILEVAKNGGRGMYNFPEMGSGDEKIVKVALGEPEMIYTHRYDYQNGISNEYLVPSLLFPVLQEPKEGEYFSKTVIVPVIKEFFDMKPQMPMMYKNEMAR